jgi:hypothetical protein
MPILELKEKIHQQVDLLTEEADLEDLQKTIYLFLQNRQVKLNHSAEFLADLANRAEEAQKGNLSGITTETLKEKMAQWITK